MEKIICNIGISARATVNTEKLERATFLQEALEISYKRAQSLYHQMEVARIDGDRTISVALSYRQFARYSAMRHVQHSHSLWLYAQVTEHIEETPEVKHSKFIELRPGYRHVG